MLSLGSVHDWLSGKDNIVEPKIRRDVRLARDVCCQTEYDMLPSKSSDTEMDNSEASIHVLKLEAHVLELERRLALGETALAREEKARAALEKIVWNMKSQDRGSVENYARAQQKKQSEIMSSLMLQEMKDSLLVHSKLAMIKRTFQDQEKVAGQTSQTHQATA